MLGKGNIALTNNVEVYNSEAIILCKGLETVLTIPQMQNIRRIYICLENLSMTQNAELVLNSSSRGKFQRFRDFAKKWLNSGRRLTEQ